MMNLIGGLPGGVVTLQIEFAGVLPSSRLPPYQILLGGENVSTGQHVDTSGETLLPKEQVPNGLLLSNY